jgi:VWFA-related protein
LPQRVPEQQQAAQQPQFRSGVLLVPVDVRVLDNKTGKAVTDLKQTDFTILENGVPQIISQFYATTLKPEDRRPDDPKPKMALRMPASDLNMANRRVFLLMLGRGRLQEPSMGLDALATFVRTQLLPQDMVAVFAYDRATDFTTDHERIAQLIDRFKTAHLDINVRIENETSAGLAGVYGSARLSKSVQARIDAVFLGTGVVGSQRVEGKPSAQAAADARTNTDAGQRAEQIAAAAEMAKLDGVPSTIVPSIRDEIDTDAFAGLPFEEFVSQNAQMLQDLSNVYACIEYLRRFDGEKHLVFLTQYGLALPRREEDELVARTASDARVVIDTFQTGGLKGQPGGVSINTWTETIAFSVLHSIAQETGGVSSIAESGGGVVAMNRINASTLAGYQLGYYPSTSALDGAFRKITVKVNRPGATVLSRSGYYARRDIPAFNRRDFITEQRITSALNFRRDIDDIKLKLTADVIKSEGNWAVKVQLRIDPSKLAVPLVNGVRTGRVDIATIIADENGQILANRYDPADIKIPENTFVKVRADWIPYVVTIPSSPAARYVRVVVYDYRADLIGRAETKVW